MAGDTVYLCGTDNQGNLRVVRVPPSMDEDEARDLVEEALAPPYGRVFTMSMAEIRTLAKHARRDH